MALCIEYVGGSIASNVVLLGVARNTVEISKLHHTVDIICWSIWRATA